MTIKYLHIIIVYDYITTHPQDFIERGFHQRSSHTLRVWRDQDTIREFLLNSGTYGSLLPSQHHHPHLHPRHPVRLHLLRACRVWREALSGHHHPALILGVQFDPVRKHAADVGSSSIHR